jgi:hypothetical protein
MDEPPQVRISSYVKHERTAVGRANAAGNVMAVHDSLAEAGAGNVDASTPSAPWIV